MFSIIVPVYNKAPFVRACLESIKSQTYRDFEAIIVNDGSTDASEAIILEAIKDDSRFRYMACKNGGVSRARNTGAQLAKHPWLAFIDADDSWKPEFLDEMNTAIGRYSEVDLVSSGFSDKIGGRCEEHNYGFSEKYTCNYDFYSHTLDFHMPICTSAVVIRKSAFIEMGGFAEGISSGEDIMLWVQFIASRNYLFVNRSLATYEHADLNSLTRCRTPQVVQSRETVLKFLYAKVKAGTLPHRFFDSMCQIHFEDFLEDGQSRQMLGFWLRHGSSLTARHWVHGALQLCGMRTPLKRGLGLLRQLSRSV